MINKTETIPIKTYLQNKNIVFKESNNELISKCVFCEKYNHLYFSSKTSQYHCKRCGETGNIFTLAKYLGDSVKDIAISDDNFGQKSKSKKQAKKLDKSIIKKCQKQIPDNIRDYLIGRGITEGQIRANSLGYGFFYGKWWITMPILDKNGDFVFLKLRKCPFDDSHDVKGRVWPKGSKVEIYGWEELNSDIKDMAVVCEGEMDKLVLENQGIPAITSTAGAGTFKDEWIPYLAKYKKIYICFDNDEAGKLGGIN